jgi:hypothetical protein
MSRSHVISNELPASPPPEVLQQLDVAWERSRELFESDLEMHFEVDPFLGRVWAELRMSSDGSLVERLSASEALSIACGEARADLLLAA